MPENLALKKTLENQENLDIKRTMGNQENLDLKRALDIQDNLVLKRTLKNPTEPIDLLPHKDNKQKKKVQ